MGGGSHESFQAGETRILGISKRKSGEMEGIRQRKGSTQAKTQRRGKGMDMDRPQGWEGEHSRLEVFRSRCTEMIIAAV